MPSKTALVTGANGGLGTHVTKALLDAGFAVAGLAPRIQQSDFDHPSSARFRLRSTVWMRRRRLWAP